MFNHNLIYCCTEFFSEETEVSRQGFSQGHPRAGAEAARDPVPTESCAPCVPGRASVAAKPSEGEAPSGSRQEGGKQPHARSLPRLQSPQPGTALSPQEVLNKHFLDKERSCGRSGCVLPLLLLPPSQGVPILVPFPESGQFLSHQESSLSRPSCQHFLAHKQTRT